MTDKKSKLVLADSVFSTEQLLRILQRTPPAHIYRRPAKGGGEWDYVTGVYVKKVLNMVFGWMWSSEVRRIEEKHGQVVATIRLTIHKKDGSPLLWKEDIGKKDIAMKRDSSAPLDYGNDEKAAITDGLKRCAAQFGIAGDIYGKDEFKEIKREALAEKPIPKNPDDDLPATAAQKKTLKGLGGEVTGKMTQIEAKEAIADVLKGGV